MSHSHEALIYLARRPFEKGHRCIMGATDYDKAINMLKYIDQAEQEGFTSFSSYQACTKIVKLVTENLALSLISNDEFIRTLAEKCGEIK